jgi:poly-gamma-glutamate capsule biosynthesis protein CapA/YwtB (metallophosphatase superfamily)
MPRLEVAVAGDCMPSRGALITSDPYAGRLRDLLRTTDFAVANLETLVSGWDSYPAFDRWGGHLVAGADVLDELRDLGLDAVGCANNHCLDMGVEGLLAAMDALRRHRLPFAGVGHDLPDARRPVYVDRPHGSLALISCSASFAPGAQAAAAGGLMRGRPGLNPLHHQAIVHVTGDQLAALRDIELTTGLAAQRRAGEELLGGGADPGRLRLGDLLFRRAEAPGLATVSDLTDVLEISAWVADARQRADVVVVSVHSHEQGAAPHEPAAFLRTFARLMVDAGADIVAGHGPHRLRGMELYRGRPIFYSLGNLISQIDLAERVPAEDLARFDCHPAETTPAEFFRTRSDDDRVLFGAHPRYWQTVVPVVSLDDGRPAEVTLYPVSLGFGQAVRHRGRPVLAHGPEAAEILTEFAGLSAGFDTKVTMTTAGQLDVGHVEIGLDPTAAAPGGGH